MSDTQKKGTRGNRNDKRDANLTKEANKMRKT